VLLTAVVGVLVLEAGVESVPTALVTLAPLVAVPEFMTDAEAVPSDADEVDAERPSLDEPD
jgi:hypothetical protein